MVRALRYVKYKDCYGVRRLWFGESAGRKLYYLTLSKFLTEGGQTEARLSNVIYRQ